MAEHCRNVSSSPEGQCCMPSHQTLTLTQAFSAEHLYWHSSKNVYRMKNENGEEKEKERKKQQKFLGGITSNNATF